MANPVEGKNVALAMTVGLEIIPMLCATDCTYQRGVEFVEKTGPTSGGSRQWLARLQEHTSTVSGLTKINNNASLSWFYILAITGEQTFTMTFEDDEGNTFSLSGPGLIGTMGINGPATDFSTATIEIRWNGAPVIDVIPPPQPEEVFELYITCTPGATSVSHVDLQAAGVDILGAGRSGTGLIQVSGTPASGSQEFMFTAVSGTITTDPDNPYNAGEWIYVLYKVT